MAAKTDDSGPELPPAIESAWGLRERQPKGPRPGMSVPAIVDAAVRVADADGLAAVSMSRVAKELGAATMALYRYVGSKDELLMLMVDTGYGPSPGPPPPEDDWRAGLTRWAWAEHEVLRQRSWLLHVPISGPPITPQQLGWMEDGLRCLDGTTLGEGEKMSVLLLITGYVRNEATLTSQIAEGSRAAGVEPSEMMPAYSRLVTRLIDPARFPALHRVLSAGVLTQDDDPDDEFAFGLDRILDGVEALIRRRAG
ncbi:TetR/AcrR family transcriptional regulator [Micromonospora sp. PSH03]|uniref:TetR/AcrR family transcriptional regulator n=1 Tax=Micromonospora TaxID=1873 RepID=UPI001B39AE31|nr:MULTISPECIES: TetR/AcrR family transcriptional regulator [Micromonospora]MBQ0992653.1 TetR/AcrR family transcriptional regulator C-terminal domain-containing protein [Micromonospora sp. H61]MCG5454917.1 TetR/AcrR family transcriptional regulator [Micromonospora salmantinae]